MNKTQALSRLQKIWGKKAAIEDTGKVTSPEQRAADKKTWEELKANPPAKTEPQEVRQAHYKAQRKVEFSQDYYRYQVGEVDSMGGFGMFVVHGKGDTLEEAVKAAEATKSPPKK